MQKSGFTFMVYFYLTLSIPQGHDRSLPVLGVGPPTCDTFGQGRSACVHLEVEAIKDSKKEDKRKTWTFAVSPGSGFPRDVVTFGRTLGESGERNLQPGHAWDRQYLGHGTAIIGTENVSA
jgi:hypothetical protein